MTQWDTFDASTPRTLERLGFSDNVEVFEPTESYSSSEGGFSQSYTSQGTIPGEVVPPEADPQVLSSGTLAEKDLMVYVNNDAGFQFTEYGTSGDASAKLRIDGYDDDYRVEERNEQLDGYIQLGCVEI